MADQATAPLLSITVPVFNEVESLAGLVERLTAAVAPLGLEYEILLVDDGSTDGSGELLDRLAGETPRLQVLHFRRNFGQTAALAAGIDHARGEIVVTLDADLQNDPADIPLLLEKINQGYDVVSGWRKNRQDEGPRMFLSRVANRVISKITGVMLNDYGCTLKAYRRSVIKDVRLYGEMHRFIPAWANWVGARVVEVPVRHHPRQFGSSKYGMGRIYKVILDLLTVMFMMRFSTKPIRIFGGVGLIAGALGALSFLAVLLMKLLIGMDMTGNPFFLTGILLTFAAVQLLAMGLLGEMNMRTYHESQGKPIYYLREPKSRSGKEPS
ncbi:MAG: glycosyltransferase family 2 protein [Myxococcales bacterium]|nr:glycosyltransferase family 2 protein [Myxococcales bacterium]